MKRTEQAGFTLVELLTVIAIIALLAALILGLAGNAQRSAARNKAEAEFAQLESFITDYQMKYGQVPQSLAALSNALAEAQPPLVTLQDPWGEAYSYSNSSRVTFNLWSRGGDLTPFTNRAIWVGNPP